MNRIRSGSSSRGRRRASVGERTREREGDGYGDFTLPPKSPSANVPVLDRPSLSGPVVRILLPTSLVIANQGWGMIAITRRIGKLGNRLILFAHFIACARENNVSVYNPSFQEYARYFASTRHDLWCRYEPNGPDHGHRRAVPWEATRTLLYHATYLPPRWLAALKCTDWPVKVIRIPMEESYDPASPEFKQLLRTRRLVVVQGWSFFGDGAALSRNADAVREYFRPIPEHVVNVSRISAAARARGDVLVGVHCRQGDYKTAFGGKYWYSVEQYREVLRRIVHRFAPRKVSFLVCSDAPQIREALAGLNVSWGSGQLIEDMYAFAECDYLVGPPSTFSGWASFYGQVPICRLETADAEIKFKDALYSVNKAA
jgi:hypothetical protein